MNVVILLNDQHAHQVLGCAGFPHLQTPAADALAADGLRFEQAVCAVTPCLPSRHAISHGLYAFQTGIYTNGHCMPLDVIPSLTMARAFRDAGHRTAAIGKMHWFPYHAPVPRGRYFGYDYRAAHFNETGDVVDTHFVKEHPDLVRQASDVRAAHGVGVGGDDCAAAFKGFALPLTLSQTRDGWLGEQAANWVREQAGDRFFLMNSFPGPHAPHAVPSDYADLYDPISVELPPEPPAGLADEGAYAQYEGLSRDELRVAIANYMGYVTAVDACHERVIQALKDEGVYDETLIVMMSDHGELLGARGPAAFSKYNLYDPSIRVPLIVKPPKGYEGARGATSDALVSLVDLLPTLLDFAGLEGGHSLPGISLKPLFEGKSLARQRRATLTEFLWKGSVHTAIRSRDWKLVNGPHGRELYHIAEDPHEFNNLAADGRAAPHAAELEDACLEEIRLASQGYASRYTEFERQDWNPLTM